MVQEQLTKIFEPVEIVKDLVHFRNFRKLVPMYYCSATKEEEYCCINFLAAHTGNCCYVSVVDGQKICRLDR